MKAILIFQLLTVCVHQPGKDWAANYKHIHKLASINKCSEEAEGNLGMEKVDDN